MALLLNIKLNVYHFYLVMGVKFFYLNLGLGYGSTGSIGATGTGPGRSGEFLNKC